MFLIKIIKEGHTTKKTEIDVAIGTVEAEGIIMPTPLFNNSYIPWKPVSFINSIIVWTDIHIGFRAYKIRLSKNNQKTLFQVVTNCFIQYHDVDWYEILRQLNIF